MAIGFTKKVAPRNKLVPPSDNMGREVEYLNYQFDRRLAGVVYAADGTPPAKLGRPPSGKKRVTLLLDPEVIAKFKAGGDGWQARMNEALRKANP